jgi:predicted  nucleic acid-binding Zn-ribbon protein
LKVAQIELDLVNQQKAMTKFQSDMTKLQHENETMQKTIETAKTKIADTELQVTANLEEQAAAQKLIDDQKLMIEAIQKKLDETKAKKPN